MVLFLTFLFLSLVAFLALSSVAEMWSSGDNTLRSPRPCGGRRRRAERPRDHMAVLIRTTGQLKNCNSHRQQ